MTGLNIPRHHGVNVAPFVQKIWYGRNKLLIVSNALLADPWAPVMECPAAAAAASDSVTSIKLYDDQNPLVFG